MSLNSLLKNKLDSETDSWQTYYARYEGKGGLLAISKKKILFVEEKGLMRKSYDVLLEVELHKIHETTVDKNTLMLHDGAGKKFNFTPDEVSASTIQKRLKELTEA